MNLTQPPFDDVHVRKAVNLVMDKAGLHQGLGRPARRRDRRRTSFRRALAAGARRATTRTRRADFAGDVDAAMEEMKQSKYDTDEDGLCDAPECKGVLHIIRQRPPATRG